MNFSLIPFTPLASPQITIRGVVHRRGNKFSFSYIVAGGVTEIYFPPSIANPTRTDDLWKTTCFEFFIAVKDSPCYWEFNLSPSGEWNAYVMDAYRQVNMRRETRLQQMQFITRKDAESFSLEGEFDLSTCITEESRIEVGITTVIKTSDEKESFWALAHPHVEADFHLRNSFILEFA